MANNNFLNKIASPYVWGNALAAVIVVIWICIGVKWGIDYYTHHGESVVVPNIEKMQLDDAKDKLESIGLQVAVNDSGYDARLPPDCILAQNPKSGKRVKGGYVVYVTVNAAHPPMLTIPDVIDNGSWREVRSMMLSAGFNMVEPEYIPGEKDWIYSIKANGRQVKYGDRVYMSDKIQLVIGNGLRGEADSIMFDNSDVEIEQREVDVPVYDYEEVEVLVDGEGNEL